MGGAEGRPSLPRQRGLLREEHGGKWSGKAPRRVHLGEGGRDAPPARRPRRACPHRVLRRVARQEEESRLQVGRQPVGEVCAPLLPRLPAPLAAEDGPVVVGAVPAASGGCGEAAPHPLAYAHRRRPHGPPLSHPSPTHRRLSRTRRAALGREARRSRCTCGRTARRAARQAAQKSGWRRRAPRRTSSQPPPPSRTASRRSTLRRPRCWRRGPA